MCRTLDPAFADLIELLIGTGLRKGEALGLCWDDVDPAEHTLRVRRTLSAINNSRMVVSTPKTRASKAKVALSPRVQQALDRRRANRPEVVAGEWGVHGGFVFCRPDGRPRHPQWVLNHFHTIARIASVPCCAIHDLRHLAAAAGSAGPARPALCVG
ncbi:tyrosine-type recombinase/integrase [Streptacidiphilus sp. BW17]|uniref:tyrosine-type recombinase/integrase n=1 Tax=Streptacidiphilus sp. BW17 TaxID=3156274 RepID=UPI003513ED35